MNTKRDFQECLNRIITPLLSRFTEGNVGVKCGYTGSTYDEKTIEMEGFSRILWGIAPFWCGGGDSPLFEKNIVEGIKNGTNPKSKWYWGEIKDYDQKTVETAAIALAILLCPDKIWSPLTEEEKRDFYNWISGVNHVISCDNNWQLFRVLVNIALKRVNMPCDEEIIKISLERIESFYIGNGWYSDGVSPRMDYYISFAIHFYSLIYAKLMERDDPENSIKFKKRAERFAKDFIYWFDDRGAALAFGRSQTYRFAQCCFWSSCVFAGIKPFPMGVMKGIISRHLEYWLSLPIFDNGDVLSIGYGYPNLSMAEQYNAPGSPYWALKSFLILALDDEHEFFKTEALPLPELEKIHIIPEARMVIQRMDDYVVALTAGQWVNNNFAHIPEKYSKFAYSSKYAFSVPRTYWILANAGTDSMLVFEKDDICFVRKECQSYEIKENGVISSKWSPLEGVCVETVIIPNEVGHIRRHTITSDKKYNVYDCAFATPDNVGDITGDGEEMLITCAPNTNLQNPNTFIKAMKYVIEEGVSEIETIVVYPK